MLGLGLLIFAIAAGLGLTFWLGTWGTQQRVQTAIAAAGGEVAQMPHPRTGLVPSAENLGQVLFGRYCDSCHPGGNAQKGENLLNAEFRRDFHTEAEVLQIIRDGTCTMPAYTRFMIPDNDAAEIAKFTLARAKAAGASDPSPALAQLDGKQIMVAKCADCHNRIDKPLDARDVQVIFALDEMSRCAGLTGTQKDALRTYLRSQQIK